MRKSVGLFFIITMILAFFASGCGKNIDTWSPTEDPSASAAGEKPEVPIDERTGVVIETTADIFAEPEITSVRTTQAIFNQPLQVLEEKEGWSQVDLLDGHKGWMKTRYISRDCTSIDSSRFSYKVVVTAKEKKIMSQPKGGIVLINTVMGTVLYTNGTADGMYKVALPGNVEGWIEESGVIRVPVGKEIPKTSVEDFITTALKFKGTSFLAGGISSMGMDGTGLIFTCGKINGISVPREPALQYASTVGKQVERPDIQPGDLVFFYTGEDLSDITLAGIFLGNNEFLYADRTKGCIMTGSLESDYFSKRLAGVKRIF